MLNEKSALQTISTKSGVWYGILLRKNEPSGLFPNGKAHSVHRMGLDDLLRCDRRAT